MPRGDLVLRRNVGGWQRGVSALALAALVACGTPPVVHLHSLMPDDVRPTADSRARPPAVTPPLLIVLDPIRLPAQVDQPQWLVQLPDGSLASLEQERWASPLRDELQQAVLETLIVRHGVVELRHSGNPVTNATSALRVGIDVRRFDSAPGRDARIEGSWTIVSASPSAAPALSPVHCEWLFREPAPGGATALAAAHRRAVSRLADGVGAAAASIKRGEPAACPASDSPG